jgi:imidazolonepropionase
MSYLEIAKAGGGIATTVRAVRAASREELVALALPRLARMLANGVTTVEIKSGYGLNAEDEIKMLEVVQELKELQPIEIAATYLAAHTIPPEYRDRRDAYVDLVVSDELMGRVADENLAEFCDVFCEASAFTVDESRRILEKGKDHGLTPKIHADQITQMGASRLAAEVGCVTAEHLEHVDDGGIAALKDASVVAGLLPGCSFYLGVPQAPARRLIDAGIPVTIATDYNPGSSMVESLPLVLSIACTQMKMTPAEALEAATSTAARALLCDQRIGRIEEGLEADLVILDVPTVASWLSQIGRTAVSKVLKRGKVVYERPS